MAIQQKTIRIPLAAALGAQLMPPGFVLVMSEEHRQVYQQMMEREALVAKIAVVTGNSAATIYTTAQTIVDTSNTGATIDHVLQDMWNAARSIPMFPPDPYPEWVPPTPVPRPTGGGQNLNPKYAPPWRGGNRRNRSRR